MYLLELWVLFSCHTWGPLMWSASLLPGCGKLCKLRRYGVFLLCKMWKAMGSYLLNYHYGSFRGKRGNIHSQKSHQTLKDQYSNTAWNDKTTQTPSFNVAMGVRVTNALHDMFFSWCRLRYGIVDQPQTITSLGVPACNIKFFILPACLGSGVQSTKQVFFSPPRLSRVSTFVAKKVRSLLMTQTILRTRIKAKQVYDLCVQSRIPN